MFRSSVALTAMPDELFASESSVVVFGVTFESGITVKVVMYLSSSTTDFFFSLDTSSNESVLALAQQAKNIESRKLGVGRWVCS